MLPPPLTRHEPRQMFRLFITLVFQALITLATPAAISLFSAAAIFTLLVDDIFAYCHFIDDAAAFRFRHMRCFSLLFLPHPPSVLSRRNQVPDGRWLRVSLLRDGASAVTPSARVRFEPRALAYRVQCARLTALSPRHRQRASEERDDAC